MSYMKTCIARSLVGSLTALTNACEGDHSDTVCNLLKAYMNNCIDRVSEACKHCHNLTALTNACEGGHSDIYSV